MRHTMLLLLSFLFACDEEISAKANVEGDVEIDLDVDGDPEVEIWEPMDRASVPVNSLTPCQGRIYDEADDLASDSFSWYLDGQLIGNGLVPANGEVSSSFTLTSYGLHFLKLEVMDTDGARDEQSITLDAGTEPDADGDGVADSEDCNPSNPALYQNGSWYPDADQDGYGTAIGFQSCGPWSGFVTDPGLANDCDDQRADTHPGAAEVCNIRDDDCNGAVDDNAVDAPLWYIDMDGDGWGSSSSQKVQCTQPYGFVLPVGNDMDCDDGDPAVHPGATEVCDGGRDMDCDGVLGGMTWYMDADGDGYGDPNSMSSSHTCVQPAEGYVANDGDCNDVQNQGEAINAGALEVCDGLDNDCDGLSDDDDPSVANQSLWSYDWDLDGYGDPGNQTFQCFAPSGYIADASDCHDFDAQTWPGAFEYCDGEDDDCNGTVDDNALDALSWYQDTDGDGYGDSGSSLLSCDQPVGYSATADDCNDADALVNPGTLWYQDQDGDGYGDAGSTTSGCTSPAGYLADDQDCDDGSAGIHPGAAEACDGIDQNCEGRVDEEVPDDPYEVAGVSPYDLGSLSGTKSVVGWFSSTDTAGEDWYMVTVTTSRSEKKVTFSYTGPGGHTVTVEDSDSATPSNTVSSGSPLSYTVKTNSTVVFTVQIVSDSTLTDNQLCDDAYTLTIQ